MSQRSTKRTGPTPSAPPTPKTEPDAPLYVKLLKPDKEPAPPSPWLRWFLVLGIVLGVLFLTLWSAYDYPRMYPSPVKTFSLYITLAHPKYISLGDEAELDVTVTNKIGRASCRERVFGLV